MGNANDLCGSCSKKCSGNVLRVGKTYFHIDCFNCHECRSSLTQGGFFSRSRSGIQQYYCTNCYQKSFAKKCASCHQFVVEGDVINALGNTYHQNCFKCSRCKQPFPTGDKITWNAYDKECLCAKCIQIPVVSSHTPDGFGPRIKYDIRCTKCGDTLEGEEEFFAQGEDIWHSRCGPGPDGKMESALFH